MRLTNRTARACATFGLWILCCGLPNFLGSKVYDIPALEPVDGREVWMQDLISISLRLIPVPVLAILARRVSYRARDGLMYLIPIYGALVFAPTVFWRVVHLPLRDWPPRPEEARTHSATPR
ncbi:hypothetical protein Acor_01460 [Acrocarpospora corrugata]|uniref:Uncharacterized protein n=1 Tax=Acrocarpospora corrugata TaxID=35763 RepID=A0A5M3VMS9_9ACTN|nr:hypothetical protein [Acrocarpospora corrugata]GER98084.1 hypothetical protein Acor_01460 [Acrocarpospora corrugata]